MSIYSTYNIYKQGPGNRPTMLLHVDQNESLCKCNCSHPGTGQNKDYTCQCTFDVQCPMLLAAFMARYTSCYMYCNYMFIQVTNSDNTCLDIIIMHVQANT